jgi:hypothetical protein
MGREDNDRHVPPVILSEAKEAMTAHGFLRFAQDDT